MGEVGSILYRGSRDELNEACRVKDERIAELEAALKPFGDAYRYTQGMGEFMAREYKASMTVTQKVTVQDLHRAAELTAHMA